jgi:hypothetical protein
VNVTDWSIRHRVAVWVLMVLIAVAGIGAWTSLPRESFPEVEIPLILVYTPYQGVSPQDMETLVTRPIETELKGLAGLKEIRSTSSEGLSAIEVEFNPDVDLDTALQKVREKVDLAKSEIPLDADDTRVQDVDLSQIPVLLINLSGEVGLVQLKEIAEDLKDALEAIPGVNRAQVIGGWVGSGSLKQGGQANCPLEGAPGTGIRVERGASARVSSTIALLGGVAFCGEDGPLTVVEGDYESASPPDLNLHWEAGIPQVGIGTALEVNDVPGTLVILLVGIEPANVPLFKWKGNPVLVNLAFTTPILNLGAGGFASVPVGFPPSLPYGLPIIVQAAALRPDGSFQLSNSSTNVTSPPPPPSCDPIPCPPTR